jgi:hypothetical protein
MQVWRKGEAMKIVKIENMTSRGLDGVGESFRPENWLKLVGSTQLNSEFAKEVWVTVLPELGNPHDVNAVALYVDGIHLGYLSSADALKYRPEIDKLTQAGAQLVASGSIWWIRRVDGIKTNIRVNLPSKWVWDGQTQELTLEKQVIAKKSLKAEWWLAVIVMLLLASIPYVGAWLGLSVFAVSAYLIRSGKFRLDKLKLPARK